MGDDLGTPHLRLERDGVVAWCVIDRPSARNALTPAMYLGIKKAVHLVNTDPELRALIITGTGDVWNVTGITPPWWSWMSPHLRASNGFVI